MPFNCFPLSLKLHENTLSWNILSSKHSSLAKTTTQQKNKEIVDDLRRFVYWREVSLKPEHDKRVGKLNLGKWNNNEIVYKGCRGKGPPCPFEGLASKEIRCLWTQTEISFSVELYRNWVTFLTRLRPCSVLIPDVLFIYLEGKSSFPLLTPPPLDDLLGLNGHKTFKGISSLPGKK